MPQNPLDALRKAASIGAPPGRVTLPDASMDASIDDPGNWVRGEMPMGPRMPKMGGELYQVLERAALKSGMGEAPNAVEGELLQKYTNPLLGKGLPSHPAPYEGTAENFDKYNEMLSGRSAGSIIDDPTRPPRFQPWAGLQQLKQKLGF